MMISKTGWKRSPPRIFSKNEASLFAWCQTQSSTTHTSCRRSYPNAQRQKKKIKSRRGCHGLFFLLSMQLNLLKKSTGGSETGTQLCACPVSMAARLHPLGLPQSISHQSTSVRRTMNHPRRGSRKRYSRDILIKSQLIKTETI